MLDEAPTESAAPGAAMRKAGRLQRVVRWCLRGQALKPVRLSRRDWAYIVALFLLSRVLIFAIGVLGTAMFPSTAPGQSWVLSPATGLSTNLWHRLYDHFDSGWYLGISHHYLLASSGQPDWLREWAFFPFYPLVLHAVSVALAIMHVPGDTDIVAGVLVSYAALFGALVYLYRLACAELSAEAARRSITYLLIFPASFYLSAIYPEGLFTLLTVGAFFHARRRQWFWAGALAACATLTRVQGIYLLLPLLLEFATAWYEQRKQLSVRLLSGAWLALPVAALGGYALYSHAETGYWLAFVEAGKLWGRRVTPPIYPLIRYILAPRLGGAFTFDFASANFVVAVVFLVLVVIAARRLPPSHALWLALGVLVPLSSDGHYLTSVMRYVAPLFPAFIALAAWSLRLRWTPAGLARDTEGIMESSDLRDRIVVVPSLMLLALMVVMFVNGVWAAV